jgi:PiT family inorganic phosphate transporter
VVLVLCALAIAFGLANGVHDAGNAIAAPIVTRAMTPRAALAVGFAGALLAGRAVAATLGGVVSLGEPHLVPVICSAIAGALAWNVVTLRLGLPCSSGHCLVGALAGAAWANAGGAAVRWGGMNGLHPVGVIGVLVWLSLSALLALPVSWVGLRVARATLVAVRAPRRAVRSVRRGEVVTTALLSFAHGSNDAQKTMGLLGLALLSTGHLRTFSVPMWAAVLAAGTLAIGTSFGGWRVVQTLGRRIFPISPLDGLVSQAGSAAIVLAASALGAPVSTTDVVAPSIVGVGASKRFRHVNWSIVGHIGISWLVTLPVSAALGAAGIEIWRIVR